ncbi:MAG: ROK family protein [Bacteriovoracaceae bacterium]
MSNDYILAYDIGGTKIEISIYNFLEGEHPGKSFSYKSDRQSIFEMGKKRIPTERQRGLEAVTENLKAATFELLSTHEIEPHQIGSVGVGLPGSVDPQTQKMLMGNSQIFIGFDFHEYFKSFLPGLKNINVQNDANLFALAEAACGAGKQYDWKNFTLIGIILGTGVGGGLFTRGRLLIGKNGSAGEIGHTTLHPGGKMCYCGQQGCAEQYLSGPSLEALFNSRRYSQIHQFQSASSIFELAKKSDPLALAVLNQYRKDLAAFLTKLTNIFDPDVIVLGGGISKQEIILEGVAEEVERNRFVPGLAPTICKHKIGDSAGGLGAAIAAFEGDSI